MAKSPPLPRENIHISYETIDVKYSKGKNPLSDKSKFRLRQLGMSTNGISELTSAKAISSQKDMQIVAMLVSRALG